LDDGWALRRIEVYMKLHEKYFKDAEELYAKGYLD